MSIWLLKTEPAECGIEDIRNAEGGVMRWDGIRNFQARNMLRDRVAVGDLCLIYHSGVREPAIVGSAEVVRAAYADPAQFDPASEYYDERSHPEDPRWFCVDIRFCERFPHPLRLAEIKRTAALAAMVLLRQGRLSVQPVSQAEWRSIRGLCGARRG